ncbi:hypothetical protein BT96DRAFT_938463 [Gymnopus androsaceus JB14]|uniref:Uncharacterized protein n=1 Tax=Gymnopus androsaceus JB14 TaxID=1447944 RepID=A0A6A4HTL3_9AGAR|nr:hypothetical protein BT96DRAFT_938463 [Gymnopus androsaceus JB14]
MVVVITVRADSASASPSTSSLVASSAPTLSTTSVLPSASSSSPGGESVTSFSKNVLEWLFLALVVLALATVIHRRLNSLRRNGIPPSSFFSARSHNLNPRLRAPRTAGRFPSAYSNSLSAYVANVPVAYDPFARFPYSGESPNRSSSNQTATRAADIDAGGRRAAGGPSDYNGDMGDKDALPAYDKFGGPPGYIDSLPALPSAAYVPPQELAPEYSPVEEPRGQVS